MITIKAVYRDTVIAYNNSGVSLNRRSQEDLIDLGILAHSSGDPSLLVLFEKLPSLDQLKRAKLEGVIRKPNVKGEGKTK